jgi:hypothetical protein
MKDNKYKVIELFIYIIVVVIGLALLLFGKAEPVLHEGGAETPPPITTNAKGGAPDAVLFDEQ